MRVSTKPTTKSNVRKETLTKVLGHETVYKGVDTAEKIRKRISIKEDNVYQTIFFFLLLVSYMKMPQ